MRPLCRALFLFSVSILLLSCSHIKKFLYQEDIIVSNQKIHTTKKVDYIDHLSSLSKSIISNKDVMALRLSKRNNEYLLGIFQRIVSNNELLLPKGPRPQFYLISVLYIKRTCEEIL
jgi:hypothetical protein